MDTSADNILPKRFDLHRRVGNFSLENSLNLAGRTAFRGSRDEIAHFFGQREICFISHHQHVRNLCRNKLIRDSFAAHQADTTRGYSIQASAIVQAVCDGFPQDGIHIQKIMPKQLFDGVWFRGRNHVGVIFNAPEIKYQPFGTNLALHATKGVRGLVYGSQ